MRRPKANTAGNFADSGCMHPQAQRTNHSQMFGDVWEWTSSSYGPYPGYAPLPGVLGEYNGKFMSSQWVLRGVPAPRLKAIFARAIVTSSIRRMRGSSVGFVGAQSMNVQRQAYGTGSASRDRKRNRGSLRRTGKQNKSLSPKYFYDEQGSQLFEAITQLDEYYPTRTELGLFDAHLSEIADLIGEGLRH